MAMLTWQSPRDSSPVPVPENWEGGGLEAIGGGGKARTWYHVRDDVRVIYEPFNREVALQEWTGGEYRPLKTLEAEVLEDLALASEARQLMKDYNSSAVGSGAGSDVGFVFGDSFGGGSGDLDF
jgi:hypothetical protein